LWFFTESKPACRTNVSLLGNVVDAADHIEIQCNVTYNGVWTPVFICAARLPGTNTNNTSSNHVLYKRVIAASDIEDSIELSCTITFTLVNDYQTNSPDIPITLKKPTYDFVWKTSTIHVVNTSGKQCFICRVLSTERRRGE